MSGDSIDDLKCLNKFYKYTITLKLKVSAILKSFSYSPDIDLVRFSSLILLVLKYTILLVAR